jgi:hypothetical protein
VHAAVIWLALALSNREQHGGAAIWWKANSGYAVSRQAGQYLAAMREASRSWARSAGMAWKGSTVEISISGVTAIRLTAIESYDFDDEDEDEDDEPSFYRTLTIETESGTLEIELDAESEDALEIEEEDEED